MGRTKPLVLFSEHLQSLSSRELIFKITSQSPGRKVTLNIGGKKKPGLFDDIYNDCTFVEAFDELGLDCSQEELAKRFAFADYHLAHANQAGRYNIRQGIMPPASGHWLNNPHADDLDFQIEADFIGLMAPAMLPEALDIASRVGHIMNSGDGFYGGAFVAALYSSAFL